MVDSPFGTTVTGLPYPSDSSGNNRTATLQGGAAWNAGRIGGTSWMNGTTAYASTAGPVLRTDQSFSVAAWVYLTKNDTWYTAISQDGGNRAVPFVLQYNRFFYKWNFLATGGDVDNPSEKFVLSSATARLGEWTHLAAVYDATAHEMRLFVNGALNGVTTGATIWRADGPFTMGRTKSNGSYVQNWPGGIDEVRTYDRPLVDSEVRQLHQGAAVAPLDHWQFDEGSGTVARDALPRGNHGTLTGGAGWTTGVHGGAVQLNGGSAAVEMPNRGVASMDSFTVTAWANPTTTALWRDVVTQGGNRRSAFGLTSAPNNGQWMFVATAGNDDGSAIVAAAANRVSTLNQWTHLAGVYDAAARQLRLYVNGILVDVADGAAMWNATGGLAVGRGTYQGNPTDYFAGAIDDVRTYQGILPEDQIRALATR